MVHEAGECVSAALIGLALAGFVLTTAGAALLPRASDPDPAAMERYDPLPALHDRCRNAAAPLTPTLRGPRGLIGPRGPRCAAELAVEGFPDGVLLMWRCGADDCRADLTEQLRGWTAEWRTRLEDPP